MNQQQLSNTVRVGDKYEILYGEDPCVEGAPLGRIRALRPIPAHNIAFGEVGGWIQNPENLSAEGDAWVGERAVVLGNGTVSGDAIVKGFARVINSAVLGCSQVLDDAEINNSTIEDSVVSGRAQVAHSTLTGTRAKDYARIEESELSCALVADKAEVSHSVLEGEVLVLDTATIAGATLRGYMRIAGTSRVEDVELTHEPIMIKRGDVQRNNEFFVFGPVNGHTITFYMMEGGEIGFAPHGTMHCARGEKIRRLRDRFELSGGDARKILKLAEKQIKSRD